MCVSAEPRDSEPRVEQVQTQQPRTDYPYCKHTAAVFQSKVKCDALLCMFHQLKQHGTTARLTPGQRLDNVLQFHAQKGCLRLWMVMSQRGQKSSQGTAGVAWKRGPRDNTRRAFRFLPSTCCTPRLWEGAPYLAESSISATSTRVQPQEDQTLQQTLCTAFPPPSFSLISSHLQKALTRGRVAGAAALAGGPRGPTFYIQCS